MAIKKTDIQSLNYLALQALNDKQNEPEFKARFEEWKNKKRRSNSKGQRQVIDQNYHSYFNRKREKEK